jgi:ATP-binding cassette subfamily F protein 1
MQRLFYYRGNYSMFRKMLGQKRVEQIKEFEKQEKKIKELKKSGKSSKKAESETKKDQQKKGNKGKSQKDDRDDEQSVATANLLQRPKEYVVKFRFPEPPPLQPPILGLHDAKFKYPTAGDHIFENIEFGIDMDSRVAIVGPNGVSTNNEVMIVCTMLSK